MPIFWKTLQLRGRRPGIAKRRVLGRPISLLRILFVWQVMAGPVLSLRTMKAIDIARRRLADQW